MEKRNKNLKKELKKDTALTKIPYLEETVFIITDLAKELFILFLILIVTKNYLINFATYTKSMCESNEELNPSNSNGDQSLNSNGRLPPNKFIKEYISDTVNNSVDKIFYFMKCAIFEETITDFYRKVFKKKQFDISLNEVSNMVALEKINALPYFVLYLIILYVLFMLSTQKRRNISWFHILQDLMNKSIYIAFIPMLLIIITSLLYIITMLWFTIFTNGLDYGMNMNKIKYWGTMIIIGIFIFLPVWVFFFQVLIYLFAYNNISYLLKPTGLDAYTYIILLILIFIISIFGFYKILFFTLKSSFWPFHNLNDIYKYGLNIKNNLSIYIIILFVASVFLLNNIKNLFSVDVLIVGTIFSILLGLQLLYNLYKAYKNKI